MHTPSFPPRFPHLIMVLTLLLLLRATMTADDSTLRVVTINVWSGLDYRGTFSFGEYEGVERRRLRFEALVRQLRGLAADIVLLQEANPVAGFAGELADSLGCEQVHQVCMGGVKIGPVGIPANFKEGIAILARTGLNLRQEDVWKLSGGPGLHGDVLTLQFTEANFALVASVVLEGRKFLIVNVHLHSVARRDTVLLGQLEQDRRDGRIPAGDYDALMNLWHEELAIQAKELDALQERLADLPPHVPVILGGDFNAEEERLAGFMERSGFRRQGVLNTSPPTWAPGENENVEFSTRPVDAAGDSLDNYGKFSAAGDLLPSRIDHILVGKQFGPHAVSRYAVVLDSTIDGIHASDHYGIAADISIAEAAKSAPLVTAGLAPVDETTTEPMPILSYDTDAGLGYGLKLFALNHLNLNESFDLVLFNSTKGERWYRFVFSLPDFELRQGKRYPLACDLTVDYDKWIKNSYFGVGNTSSFEDREYYTREPLDVSLVFSRAFSHTLVGQTGLRYTTTRNFGYADTSALLLSPSPISAGKATSTSLLAAIRVDTRDSYVSPSRGMVLQAELEAAPLLPWSNVRFIRAGVLGQYYHVLFYPKTVFAARLWLQSLFGNTLPVQTLLPIGGNKTLRGYVQDRYLDMVSGVINLELRFPIIWRFGGVVGYDLGKVWKRPGDIDLVDWAVNPVVGGRFVFDTFVVRLDVGFGPETTGFYLNFGHLF